MRRSMQSDIGCLIRFIPAGSKTDTSPTTDQQREKGTLSGEDAKAFYEGLLQENSSKQQLYDKLKADKTCEAGTCKSNEHNESNVNLPTEKGRNELSIKTRKKSCNDQLTKKESHRNEKKQNENKLLSFAQNGDLKQLMKLLKDNPGITIDHQDQYGWTALMCATVGGHKQIVQHLLSKGANKWLKNNSDKSAIELAEEIGSKHIVKVLSQSEESIQQSSSTRKKHKQSFYCEVCKTTFSDSSEKEHSSSTVHLFNLKLKPKPDPFMIPESNIGYRLMRSSGWDGEKGLGPEGKGAKFPVKTVLKTDRLCLGSEASQKKKAKITHFGPNDTEAVKVEHKHSVNRVLSARASSRKERRRREQKEKKWEKNLRQYWDIDCEGISLDKM